MVKRIVIRLFRNVVVDEPCLVFDFTRDAAGFNVDARVVKRCYFIGWYLPRESFGSKSSIAERSALTTRMPLMLSRFSALSAPVVLGDANARTADSVDCTYTCCSDDGGELEKWELIEPETGQDNEDPITT